MENQNEMPQQESSEARESVVATAVNESSIETITEASDVNGESTDKENIPAEEMELEAAPDPDEEDDLEQPEASSRKHDEIENITPRISDSPSAKVLTEDESVQRAKFPQLEHTITTQALGKIEYLKDVDLDASVELGNTVLTVEKILNLNVGSIIELNQTIGDQVRLLINGNPYACGEVVVIGDKFGVRITKLLH